MLDPATLNTATAYHIDALPGRWLPVWCDTSEVVFHGSAGKLLVPAAQLTVISPGHLHLTGISDDPSLRDARPGQRSVRPPADRRP